MASRKRMRRSTWSTSVALDIVDEVDDNNEDEEVGRAKVAAIAGEAAVAELPTD